MVIHECHCALWELLLCELKKFNYQWGSKRIRQKTSQFAGNLRIARYNLKINPQVNHRIKQQLHRPVYYLNNIL